MTRSRRFALLALATSTILCRSVPALASERGLFIDGDKSYDSATGALRRWFHVDAAPPAGGPAEAARGFLIQESSALGLKPGLPDLVLVSVRHGLGTQHVRFRQTLGGFPVYASEIVVSLNPAGRVAAVASDYWPDLREHNLEAQITQERAVDAAVTLDSLPPPYTIPPCASLMIDPLDGPDRLAWRVVYKKESGNALWVTFVDAHSGAILSRRDLMWDADGTGLVFDPDPITTSHAAYGDPGYTDNDDATSPQLDAQRKLRALKGLVFEGGRYYLAGPYAMITDIELRHDGPYSSATADGFAFDRHQDAFEAVMAYYHVDTMQRWIQNLGFANVNNSLQKLDPHGLNNANNSHYCPEVGGDCVDNDYIAYGNGGVDDAEDGEVILHEYGHAIQDDQVPGWGIYHETAAMGEGFGDYLAGSYAQAIDDFNSSWVMKWDNDGAGGRPGLRRLDSTKHYPEDLDPDREVHADGEIWSRCLWDFHNQVGRVISDRLIIQSHFYLLPGASFRDGAEALLQADEDIYANLHGPALQQIFEDRGILRPQPFDVSVASTERYPSVAFESREEGGRTYLVTWQDERDTDPDIRGARVTASGAVLDTDIILARTADLETRPDVGFLSRLEGNIVYSGFLTAYEFAPVLGDSAPDIRCFWTNWQGIAFGNQAITRGAFQSGFRPAVATVSDADGTSLVVWNGVKSGTGWGVYGARVNPKTGLLDLNGFPIMAPDNTFSAGMADVALARARFLVVWKAPGDNIEGAIVLRNATVMPKFTIAGTADSEVQPTVTFDGIDFIVAWTRFSGNSADLYAARVDTTGAVLDGGGGFRVTTTPGFDYNPAIQMGSSRALVTWYYEPGQNAKVLGATIARDGSVYNPNGLLVAPLSIGGAEPAQAFDGMTHLVAWQDGPPVHIRASIVRADSFPVVEPPGPAEVEEGPSRPSSPAEIRDVRPNPTHAGVQFTCVQPIDGDGSVRVFDVTGRLVRTIFDRRLDAGEHAGVWDGRDGTGRRVAAGQYFLRWDTDLGSDARPVVVLP